jgi:hypothetical protein
VNIQTLRQWLRGEAVNIGGSVYIFPHGARLFREWVNNVSHIGR